MQKRLEKDKALLQQRVEQMEALLKEQEAREDRMNKNCIQLIELAEEFEKRFSESGSITALADKNIAEYIGQSLAPLRNDCQSYVADSKVEAMKLSLSKIRHLSKEILQGRELLLLKSSQALLYKHQSTVIQEDTNMNRSSLGNKNLAASNLNVSKFESCDLIESIDNPGDKGPSNLPPSLPVQSVVIDSYSNNLLLPDHRHLARHNSSEKLTPRLNLCLMESPVIKNGFTLKLNETEIHKFESEEKKMEIVPVKIQAENPDTQESSHEHFKYYKRFSIETPPLFEKKHAA